MDEVYGYRDGQLYIEDVSMNEIAKTYGTPCYVYSYGFLKKSFQSYDEAFRDTGALICYSVKANSNIAILKAFSDLGSGFDIVSGGELRRVKMAGGELSMVVFSGVGKTAQEMADAIEAGILFFNVESEEELHLLNKVGAGIGKKAPIALRVNPDIDANTHPYISTGFKESKFGIEIERAEQVYREASKMEGVEIVALDAHIGSQIFELEPFIDSLEKLLVLADKLSEAGIGIKYIDIGGGIGINYRRDDTPPLLSEYADLIMSEIGSRPYKLVLEPGRSLMGNAGVMLTTVNFVKEGTEKKFVIVDAAMNDLIRPAFYDSYHEIMPVAQTDSRAETVDVVGPICESGDFLAKERALPEVMAGDILAVFSAGAYGFVMASNYNTRPRAAEILVKGNDHSLIRERETYDDLVSKENLPAFL